MAAGKTFSVLALLTLFTLSPMVAGAQNQGGGPPFRSGEVVVSGPPATLPPGTRIKKYLPYANLTVVEVEHGQEWGQVQQYRLHGRNAGINFLAAAFAVNDPLYSYQWHLSRIQSDAAWDITAGTGVTVAVLDTGLATDSQGAADGIGCVNLPYNVLVPGSLPTDGDGHGTHVSGTIAQRTDNGIGVAGLAYGACIMPVKVLDDSGSGTFADIAEGIAYAVEKGADVINMSLGVNARYNITTDPVMDPALNNAYANGVTVVCAAGNDGWRKNVSYPAIHPTTIAVGATDYTDARAPYSNYGRGLDIMAPGGNTLADVDGDGYGDGVLQETKIDSDWGYYFFQGTSMASPHVAAAAALLIAQNPGITPAQVRDKLTDSALDLGSSGYDSVYGHGLVQVADALEHTDPVCTDNDGDDYCLEDGDCNDDNAAIHPFADEVCGDGWDNDCNASTLDECPVDKCLLKGDPCSSNDQCCSGSCHPVKGCR